MRHGAGSWLRGLIVLAAALAGLIAMGVSAVGALADGSSTAFVVNSTVDAADASPGDGVCATADGSCTLRAAVQEANALPGAETIVVPAGNYALTVAGAGEGASASGDLNITGPVTIKGASAKDTSITGVAGDRVLQVTSGTTGVAISGVTISGGNGASTGGGIDNEGSLSLTDVAIRGNAATFTGGGINNGSGATLSISSSEISNNSAKNGAGIFSAGAVTLANSTVSGNTIPSGGFFGAGVRENNMATGLTISYSTIVGNTGPSNGNGINYSAGGAVPVVSNSIISGNSYGDCNSGVTSGGHNVEGVYYNATCLTSPTGGDRTNVDPLLGPLQDNGGPTLTQLPGVGSPAIDNGDSASCPATDQRGFARPVGATCDSGAAEAGAAAPAPPDTAIDSGPSGTTSDNSATFTFHSSDPSATFACSLDGASFSACSSPAQYGGLSAADHTFAVRSTNAVGTDASPATQAWTVAAPATTDTTPTDTTSTPTDTTSTPTDTTSTPTDTTSTPTETTSTPTETTSTPTDTTSTPTDTTSTPTDTTSTPTDATTTQSSPSADLVVTQQQPSTTVRDGQLVTYHDTVTNLGPDAAAAVAVTDSIAGDATLVAASIAGGSCQVNQAAAQCQLSSLAVGSSATITLSVKAGALPSPTASSALAAAVAPATLKTAVAKKPAAKKPAPAPAAKKPAPAPKAPAPAAKKSVPVPSHLLPASSMTKPVTKAPAVAPKVTTKPAKLATKVVVTAKTPDPKPGNNIGGATTSVQKCTQTLTLANRVLGAGCFEKVGSVWEATGAVTVDGLQLVPGRGVKVNLDQKTLRIAASTASLEAGGIVFYAGRVDMDLQAGVHFTPSAGARVKGYPIAGQVALTFKGQTTLAMDLTVGSGRNAAKAPVTVYVAQDGSVRIDDVALSQTNGGGVGTILGGPGSKRTSGGKQLSKNPTKQSTSGKQLSQNPTKQRINAPQLPPPSSSEYARGGIVVDCGTAKQDMYHNTVDPVVYNGDHLCAILVSNRLSSQILGKVYSSPSDFTQILGAYLVNSYLVDQRGDGVDEAAKKVADAIKDKLGPKELTVGYATEWIEEKVLPETLNDVLEGIGDLSTGGDVATFAVLGTGLAQGVIASNFVDNITDSGGCTGALLDVHKGKAQFTADFPVSDPKIAHLSGSDSYEQRIWVTDSNGNNRKNFALTCSGDRPEGKAEIDSPRDNAKLLSGVKEEAFQLYYL